MRAARTSRALAKVAVLSALWLVFSGKLDRLHLAFGALSVALVMAVTREVALAKTRADAQRPLGHPRWRGAAAYPFWLLKEVVRSNLQLARIILDPRLPIRPLLIRVDTRLHGSLARVLLANSITLTPGTFTIDVDGGVFLVHAIDETSASPAALGEMRDRAAAVFGEEVGPIRVLETERAEPEEPGR